MKHLFIVNPMAGSEDQSERIRALAGEALGGSGTPYEVYVTRAPMDACAKIVQEAASGGTLRVYACGGDGTLNECVNGSAGRANVAVTHFPCGTGNDFIKTFGAEKARFFDIGELIGGEVRPLDVMECCGRYGINIGSVGVDARIAADVHKYSGIPLIGGKTGYIVSTVVNLIKGVTQQLTICGAIRYSGTATLLCACNGRCYGGSFNPMPDARPDDGLLDFLLLRATSRLGFITRVGKYAKGRWREFPASIAEHIAARHLELESDTELVVNIDGEAIFSKHVSFDVIPNGVNFIVPKNMAFFSGKPLP